MRWEGKVSRVIDGREYSGHFRVDDKGILTVSYAGDSKSTQVGGHSLNPKPLAEVLLRELVEAAKALK